VKILLDECVPQRFADMIEGHEVRAAQDMGWASIKNGALIALASKAFDVMITVDKKMASQHDSEALKIPIIILSARSTQFKHIRTLAPKLLEMLAAPLSNKFHFIRG
jgi:predicted nuclease of predicted toxin-antitoxin system